MDGGGTCTKVTVNHRSGIGNKEAEEEDRKIEKWDGAESMAQKKVTLTSMEENLKKDDENQRFRMQPKDFRLDVKVRPHRIAKKR